MTECIVCKQNISALMSLSCKPEHYACALCISHSLKNPLNLLLYANAREMITFEPEWINSIQCPECNIKATFVVDQKLFVTCPSCDELHTAQHIISCEKGIFINCPFCAENIALAKRNDHIAYDCQKVPCALCSNTYLCVNELLKHIAKHKQVTSCLKEISSVVSMISSEQAMANVDQIYACLQSLKQLSTGIIVFVFVIIFFF